MKNIFLNPLFLFGLLIRLFLVYLALPAPVIEWFVPFMDVSTNYLRLDPWALWLEQGGVEEAFPYGYATWAVFVPLVLFCKLVGLPLIYGYGATLIVADFSLFLLLRRMHSGYDHLLLATYWLSPITIVASYLLGFNDIIPVLFLVMALYFIRNNKLLYSGLACVLAISAKMSMVLVLPFFIIYLLHNQSLRQLLPQFLQGLIIAATFILIPFIFSVSGMNMLFNNPEMIEIYRVAINLNTTTTIYLVPLVYLIMLYAAWRVKRLNFELFYAMLGMAFLFVVLMTPASPGWFIWAIPLLIFYQASSDRVAIVLTAIFSVLYVLSVLLNANFGTEAILQLTYLEFFNNIGQLDNNLISLIHTAMVATGIILGIRIWHETVRRNDYFRLSRKPFIIGIAGDSGSGKDTFSDAIQGLFGSHSVAKLSGDNYHFWDRGKPMWHVMTHLNPNANDLEKFANDLIALTDGKSIQSKHYDHQTGLMSHPFIVKGNDFILASGLHALYLPILRECFDLSVFLDIDEDLRRYFKIQRDVNQRGNTVEKVMNELVDRESDSKRFIRPQASHADLVLSLQPIHPHTLQDLDSNQKLRYKLTIISRHGLNEISLTRVLIGVCGLHVDVLTSENGDEVEIMIEGEVAAEDIALAAQMICPRIFNFLDIHPKWQDGVIGIMQLITLSHINHALMKRFI